MTNLFGETWKKYINLFWSKVSEKLVIEPPILFWGHISYSEFKKTYFYSRKPIQLSDSNLNIYFLGRNTNKDDITLFFFANLPGLENDLKRIKSSDSYFILDLIYLGFDLTCLFEHEYSQDCWFALLQTDDLVFV
jgi:hypothetical protein